MIYNDSWPQCIWDRHEHSMVNCKNNFKLVSPYRFNQFVAQVGRNIY